MIHFVTFADNKMIKTRDRLVEEAKNSGFFNEYHVFDEKNLPQEMVAYCQGRHSYGNYIWKSFVVDQVLNKIEENDILIWVDAGCVIQKEGKWRFDEYIDMVNKSEYANVSFELCDTYCFEKRYTKADIFDHFNAEDLIEGIQLNTTSFLLRNTEYTRKIVSLWKDTTLNHLYLSEGNDSVRLFVKTHKDFYDNRQDQSIFSIIRRKYGTTIIPHPIKGLKIINDEGRYIVPDPFFSELETNTCEYNSELGSNKIYPIVAKRLRY